MSAATGVGPAATCAVPFPRCLAGNSSTGFCARPTRRWRVLRSRWPPNSARRWLPTKPLTRRARPPGMPSAGAKAGSEARRTSATPTPAVGSRACACWPPARPRSRSDFAPVLRFFRTLCGSRATGSILPTWFLWSCRVAPTLHRHFHTKCGRTGIEDQRMCDKQAHPPLATTQSKNGRRCDEECKREVAALASRPGATDEQVGRDLGVSAWRVARWRRRFGLDKGSGARTPVARK